MPKASCLTIGFVIAICLCPVIKGRCQGGIPADTIKAMLIKDWERAKVYTQAYMKAMPADKYGFKANDSVRSFGQQLLHLAQATNFFLMIANGEKVSFETPQIENRLSAQRPDSVMYFVNNSYDNAINAIKRSSASDLMAKATLAMQNPYTATKLSWFMKAFEHQTHHRGQTTIYIRLAGYHPPQEMLF